MNRLLLISCIFIGIIGVVAYTSYQSDTQLSHNNEASIENSNQATGLSSQKVVRNESITPHQAELTTDNNVSNIARNQQHNAQIELVIPLIPTLNSDLTNQRIPAEDISSLPINRGANQVVTIREKNKKFGVSIKKLDENLRDTEARKNLVDQLEGADEYRKEMLKYAKDQMRKPSTNVVQITP